MNLLYPRFAWRMLPRMLLIAALGAVVGGVYGVIHDQVTYSISSEYFTKLKFDQFRYANFGFSERIFAGEVGFLATWAVGFVAAWFLARLAVPAWPFPTALRRCLRGFVIIFTVAFLAAGVGFILGLNHTPDYSNWQLLGDELGVTDLPAFVRVAYIHNAGYLGGVVGLVIAIFHLWRLRKLEAASRTG